MTDFNKLDEIILEIGDPSEPAPGISMAEAGLFFVGLKKLAQEEGGAMPIQEASLDEAVEDGEEYDEDWEMEEGEEPDTSGSLEGQFAVPVGQVVQTMAQIVSHELKAQAYYVFYSQMMRDLNRGALADMFLEFANSEMEDAKYLLRRMGVLVPGGVQIPVPPMPEPSADPAEIVQTMIACEQQAIVLLKTLHAQMGENPMKYTLEEMLSEEQEHLDKLWQHMPAKASAPEEKMASAVKIARLKISSPQMPRPKEGDIVVPEPGTESHEKSIAREAVLAAQEMSAVAEHQAQRAQQLEEQALMNQHAAESATAQAQAAEDRAAQTELLASQAQQQAAAASEQATMAEENAAQQADAKMRLAMRIQQFRQQLADIVAQDPVMEEGVGFGEEAGPGGPVTTGQQQEMAAQEEAAAQEQMAAADPKAAKQMAEARRAQNEAAEQTTEAQNSATKAQPKAQSAA